MAEQTIVTLFLAISILLFPSIGRCEKEISFSITPVLDQQYYKTLKGLLQQAEKQIGLVQLSLFSEKGSSRRITRALCRAAKRGVQVDVILEGHKGKIDERNRLTAEKLKRAGARVSFSSDNKIVHTKLVLVDDDLSLFGSTNLSSHSMNNNHESNVLIRSRRANSMLWRYLRKLRKDPRIDVNMVELLEDSTTSVFTDRRFVRRAIKVIDGAKKMIRVSSYFFARRNGPKGRDTTKLYSALANAAKRGVRVELYLEKSGFAPHLNDFAAQSVQWLLSQAKMYVRFDEPEKISHCKLIIADPSDDKNCQLILGSSNWSRGDVEINHQVNCHITNPSVVSAFDKYFKEIYKVANPHS